MKWDEEGWRIDWLSTIPAPGLKKVYWQMSVWTQPAPCVSSVECGSSLSFTTDLKISFCLLRVSPSAPRSLSEAPHTTSPSYSEHDTDVCSSCWHPHVVFFCISSRGVCATLGKRLYLCRYLVEVGFNSFRQSLFSWLISMPKPLGSCRCRHRRRREMICRWRYKEFDCHFTRLKKESEIFSIQHAFC